MVRFDMPDKTREITIQHLNMLAENKALSDDVRDTADCAAWYLRDAENAEKGEALCPKEQPVNSEAAFGTKFGVCRICNASLIQLACPKFCGNCGRKLDWT